MRQLEAIVYRKDCEYARRTRCVRNESIYPGRRVLETESQSLEHGMYRQRQQ